jgi:hypothetical protein
MRARTTLAEPPVLGHIACELEGQMAERKIQIEEVVDRDSFEHWLNALPEAKIKPAAMVLAHRLALRVLPFLSLARDFNDEYFAPFLINVLRCILVSREASISLTHGFGAATDFAPSDPAVDYVAATAVASVFATFNDVSFAVSAAADAAAYASAVHASVRIASPTYADVDPI